MKIWAPRGSTKPSHAPHTLLCLLLRLLLRARRPCKIILVPAARLFGVSPATGWQQNHHHQWPIPSGLGCVSHSVPTLCPLFALDAAPLPMAAAAAAACCTDDAFERCLEAGRCLALTALALLRDPKLVQKASTLPSQRVHVARMAHNVLGEMFSGSSGWQPLRRRSDAA